MCYQVVISNSKLLTCVCVFQALWKLGRNFRCNNLNIEHRTLNFERRIRISHSAVIAIGYYGEVCSLCGSINWQSTLFKIRRWMFDVGRSFFIIVHNSVFNRICCIQIYAGSGALKLNSVIWKHKRRNKFWWIFCDFQMLLPAGR